jgi:hypothetical protein
MPDAPIRTDLILQGRFIKKPVTLVGTTEDGELTEFGGNLELDVNLSGILKELGKDYDAAAQELNKILGNADIKLQKLGVAYRRPKGEKGSVQVGLIFKRGNSTVQMALLKRIGGDGFIAGVNVRSAGAALPANFLSGLTGEISVRDLGVYYASKDFVPVSFVGADEFRDGKKLTPVAPLPGGRKFSAGWNFSIKILVGGVDLLEKLEKPKSQDKPKANDQTPAIEPPSAPAGGSTYWMEVKKTIGPLSVRRVGLSYENSLLGIKLDASLTLSVLTVSMEGLGLTYPITKFPSSAADVWQNLGFTLDGAAVTFQQGPVTVSGGLLRVRDAAHPDRLQLDGALLVSVPAISISALASYADMQGTPSFFAFAALLMELGDPTGTGFFLVTGLAFGFGINRALTLPTIEEVHNFPLIRAATDKNYLGTGLDLREVSQKLSQYISPSPGQFWVAAGVKFNSYGLVDTFALLSVSFGMSFEIALLGLSRIEIPKAPAPVLASAELAIKVVISPASGLLSMEGRLTENSYLLNRDFKLRGGFAFYTWFSGEHAGDFVISLGGYHPRFVPPAHYPKPDLVQFYAKIGDVTFQGSCYFALCPSAIMAGISLSLVYQSGGVKAWFIAYAHFLVQWKPLHYDIAIAVLIGVSLSLDSENTRVLFSFELGASLNLYGPPLGGEAKISLVVITVTIKFGADKSTPPPLLWDSVEPEKSFVKSFLKPPDVTQTVISDGLLEEIKNKQGKTIRRLVNPHRLVITCQAQVPVTEAKYNKTKILKRKFKDSVGKPGEMWWNDEVGIRPMGVGRFRSRMKVTFAPTNATGEELDTMKQYLDQYIEVSVITRNLPRALWANTTLDSDQPEKEQMVKDGLVGLELRGKAGPRPWQTPALDLEVLSYDRFDKKCAYVQAGATRSLSGARIKDISDSVGNPDVVSLRTEILKTLKNTGRRIMDPERVGLNELKEGARYIFQATPTPARPGQYPPRTYLDT